MGKNFFTEGVGEGKPQIVWPQVGGRAQTHPQQAPFIGNGNGKKN